jgi:hypothetical protein
MVRKDYYEAAREWLHLSYQVLELDQQDPDYARRQSRTLRYTQLQQYDCSRKELQRPLT